MPERHPQRPRVDSETYRIKGLIMTCLPVNFSRIIPKVRRHYGTFAQKCATRIICARMRIAGIVPIPPIRLPMCRQINGRCRATTLRQPLVQFGSPRVLVPRVAPRAEKRKTPYAIRMSPRGLGRGRRVGAPRRAVRSIDDSLCTQIALHTSYPPASRGREWNSPIPLSACEDARGYVVSRPSAAVQAVSSSGGRWTIRGPIPSWAPRVAGSRRRTAS